MPITLAHTAPARLDWHGQHRPAPVSTNPRPPAPGPVPLQEAAFLALQRAYGPYGGLERGDALAERRARAGQGGHRDLAQQLVGGQLFSFHWDEHCWLPGFQVDALTLAPREAVRRVLGEWQQAQDGWALAWWFVRPHSRLVDRQPLAVLSSNMPAVLAAARSDRVALTA